MDVTRLDPPSRTALLVLGMHRSGTSALARMLSLLGAALPENVIGTEYRGREGGNEAGHWEPERLVKLHDEMLAEAGSRWDDWRRFELAALGPDRVSYYKSTIARLIEEEYGDAPLFVLKDPRLCRFVPLYEEILGEMGVAPRFVLTHRNPVSVLDSLAARDDMAASYASLVWLRHVLDAEEATRGKVRAFSAYEEYLDDWRTAAERISAALGLDWPRDIDDAGQEIEENLSRGLQHHAATPEDLAADQRVGQTARDAYAALLVLTADGSDAAALETLSRIRAEFESGQPFFVDATFEEMTRRQNREQLAREHLQRVADKYQGEARTNAAAKSDLETQLVETRAEARAQGDALRDTVTIQATEIGRLGAQSAVRGLRLDQLSEEKSVLDSRIVTMNDDAAAQATEIGRLASERRDLRMRHAALEAGQAGLREQNKTLQADIAALRNSTSWRLTMPVRAAKRLSTDPQGTIAFLRAEGFSRIRGLNVPVHPDGQAQPSASRPISTPVAGPPAAFAENKLSGLEQRTPAEAASVKAAFDADFYLEQYPEVAASGVDPFEHYMRFGWKEGRDPSPAFSTGYYLQRNSEIAKVGMNPFLHWVLHGIREKRPALPFHRRLELLDHAPKVSAIVPNYNHARFLGQRIDSILAQTYENVEILILDDCSTDDSRTVIDRYCEKYPDRIRAIFNDENSGNVFRQWRKGIENSTGELVWICESDDFCEPDFLEVLVKNFRDRSVNIAFGRIQFSDESGNFRPWLDQYRELAEPGIWDAPLTRPARRWFAGGFGVNNVIANVGGCIFRRRSLPEPVLREAGNYSVLGDWFLYSHFADGGQIAYEPSAVAYFRQHDGNTSVASFVTPGYYEEHERLMLHLRRQWSVPDETVEAFYGKIAFQYGRHRLDKKFGPLESHCDKQKLLAQERTRPHILVAFLGFHLGGGETFPIRLANTLYAQGHLVSMLAFDMTDVKQEMLDEVNPGIPVYDCAWVEEYGADRFLTDAGVSVIHSHMIHLEGFFFEKNTIETKVPYLVTLHGSYEIPSLCDDERILRFLLGVSHYVYTADKNLEPFRNLPLAESLFSKFDNAVPEDPRPFPKTRQELGIAEDAVVFTLVARGIKRKGWRAAVAAFQRLRKENPEREMHLLLAGEGEEATLQAELHGDDPDITFLGYQSNVQGLFRMSDVAMLPTRFAGESCPFCIIEALKTGTPVIATRVGEIPNLLDGPDGRAGILIELQRDTDLFVAGLQEAMSNALDVSERAEYTRAAEKKGKTFSMDRVAEEYVALYEDLMKNQNSATRMIHA